MKRILDSSFHVDAINKGINEKLLQKKLDCTSSDNFPAMLKITTRKWQMILYLVQMIANNKNKKRRKRSLITNLKLTIPILVYAQIHAPPELLWSESSWIDLPTELVPACNRIKR